MRNPLRLSVRSALLASVVLLGSESVLHAQEQPPAGQDGGQRGGGRQRGGGGNMFGGGMGRAGTGGGMGGMGGMGRGMQDVREALEADFQRRDIPIFVRQLNLTEDQSGVLETLMVDYEAQFQPEVEAIQTAMTDIGRNMMRTFMSPERQEQMRQTWDEIQREMQEAEAGGAMDDAAREAFIRERMQKASEKFAQQAEASGLDAEIKAGMDEMLGKMQAWQTRKAGLRDNFTESMKAVLDDDQLSQWPAFERFLIREKTLPRARISGEGVNLFLVVDDLRLPPEAFAKVEPLFNDYESRLDAALRARNGYLEESMPRLFKAVRDGDSGDAKRIFERQAQLRSAVRDVNEEFRVSMVNALAESDWAKQLDSAVLAKGWERIFRPTGTDRMFEEALKLEGLEATTVQAITDLYAQYRGEVRPMNDRLKQLARTQEPDEIVANGERFVSMMSQGVSGIARNFGRGMGGGAQGGFAQGGDDPMREVFDQRSDVGERYQERLEALLTPEQFEKLPRSGRGGRGNGGPGGEGGGFNMQGMLDRIPEEQRRQFLDAVDKNKNGTIDEDEREAARDYIRQQFQNMRGGGGAGGGNGQGDGGQGGRGGRGGRGGAPEV